MVKAYTNIDQSKKLVEVLPPESSDMFWREVSYGFYHIEAEIPKGWYDVPPKGIPCWSLSALLNYLKSKNKFPEIKELSDGRFKLTTFIWDGKNSIQFSIADNLVDACVEMILKLKGNNML